MTRCVVAAVSRVKGGGGESESSLRKDLQHLNTKILNFPSFLNHIKVCRSAAETKVTNEQYLNALNEERYY